MATDAYFVKDLVGWTNAFHTWEGTLGSYLKPKVVLVEVAAKVEAPKRTLELANSIEATYGHTKTSAMDLEAKVIANCRHAIFVHGGTRPHIIEPKGDGDLVFFWRGKLNFSKRVNHPGTRANPFLERALKQVF